MGLLRDAGMVAADRGHGGGWRIEMELSSINLRMLHEALGEPALFALGHRSERPHCRVEKSVNRALHSAFDAAETLLLQRLQSITLAELAADFGAAAQRPARRKGQ